METGSRRVVPWHALEATDVVARLGTSPSAGLSPVEAARRLQQGGPNRIEAGDSRGAWRILCSQFQDFMVLVLLGAVGISAFLGEYADALAVLAIVAVNAVLGFIQESRAERSLDALRRLTAPTARVVRGGQVQQIDAGDLVPGDLILLGAGDRVPADARLLEGVSLEAEEAALTGESRPVGKTVDALATADLPPGDRRCQVFLGTHVARGHGRAVVVATGMDTEVGRIADLIQSAGDRQTPLQRRLDALGRVLVLGCLGVSAAVVAGGVLQGEEPYRMFLAGVSLAVAAIPEGLPAVVTIALALGVQRMIRRHAVVRRLPAVETLGCATVVCSDKTGTLTQNAMVVREAYAAGRRAETAADGRLAAVAGRGEALRLALEAAALCNDAELGAGGEARGDPTEVALLRVGRSNGLDVGRLRQQRPRLFDIPFEPERRRMTVVCALPPGRGGDPPAAVYVKGALEEVLDRCAWVRTEGGVAPCDGPCRALIHQVGDGMAARALRVLAVAQRPCERAELDRLGPGPAGGRTAAERLERDLVFCGLLGMMDPPRPEVYEAVRRCHDARVRPVMITGDHALTARAVALDIGLLVPGGRVVTGAQLAGWSDADLNRQIEDICVFARVSPTDKLRIVRALKRRGHVVAMTGDGVNDAPAVKEADIGVAMGATGTDVTKEASAMVLADDNFATIVAAIEEGRGIYDNVRKFVRYLLACNTGEVLVMLIGTLAGLPLPLLPLQLLLVNLVTDGLPALALGVDPPGRDLMMRPPRDPRSGLFSGGLGRLILVRGLLIGLATLAVFTACLAAGGGLDEARTLATCTLVVSQLFHAFDARSERRSIWEMGLLTNPSLLWAAGSSCAVLLAVVYMPVLQGLFHTRPLVALDWLWVVGASSLGAALAGTEAGMRALVRRLRRLRALRAGA